MQLVLSLCYIAWWIVCSFSSNLINAVWTRNAIEAKGNLSTIQFYSEQVNMQPQIIIIMIKVEWNCIVYFCPVSLIRSFNVTELVCEKQYSTQVDASFMWNSHSERVRVLQCHIVKFFSLKWSFKAFNTFIIYADILSFKVA